MLGCLMAPVQFLKWCFTNGIKGLIVLGIVVVVVLAGFFVIRSSINAQAQPDKTKPTYTINLPSAKEAPYVIQTRSRTYYAALATKDKAGNVTMTDYWEWLGGKWTQNRGILKLYVISYGKDIKINRR